MKRKIKVIQVGLGQIGLNIVKGLLRYDDMFEVVGCVDTSPEKTGKDIGEFLEPRAIFNIPVRASVGELKKKRADVAIHSTVSFLPEAADQVAALLNAGYNVITTAEEMFFLRKRDLKTYKRLDALARRKGVRLLATGADPGYVLDSLVIMLTAPCSEVRSIRAERMVNLGRRRLSLQRKMGIGLSSQEFGEESRRFGPAGLTDSAEFIAHHLGIGYDNIRSSVQPIVADHDFRGENIFVAKNHVIGVRHEVVAERAGEAIVSLRLSMRIDPSIEYDAVFVDGDPPVNVVINNGIMGDRATVGLILNQIGNLLSAGPGVHDMGDLRIPHFSLGHS